MPLLAIDARKYFDFGIGTYLQFLIGELGQIRSRFEYLLYIAPSEVGRVEAPDGWSVKTVPFKKYSPGELLRFSGRLRKDGVSLFHEPHYTLPLNLQVPAVVTIHDLIHLQLPRYFSPVQKIYARGTIGSAVRRADAIITPTEFTKQEILNRYPAAAGKIQSIPLAAGPEFKPVSDQNILASFKRKNNIGKPYLIYCGSLKPHKNIPLLLNAFAASRTRGEIDIVFTGERLEEHPAYRRLRTDLGLDPLLHDLGKLSTADLALAITGAEALILPSEYEGFGLPLVEAMACGTPAIISDAPALVEVGGTAAISFERYRADALSAAIDRIIADTALRNRCRTAGLARSREFRWAETAQQTLAVYNALL